MNVQLSLAYFNDTDFEKACELLSSKGFNFDVPVDATQFSTFKFYSEQKINSSNYAKAKETRELLINNGSEDFNFCETTMGNIGNMFFCLVNIISQFFPFVTPQMINSSELFDFSEIDGQQIVTLRQDKMKELFDSLNFDVEINNYYETDKILEQLIKTEQSEALYVLIAMTGKNPIAPFQWVNISGGGYSKNSETANLIVANPDGLYQFVDFQVKDLTELITLKIKNAD